MALVEASRAAEAVAEAFLAVTVKAGARVALVQAEAAREAEAVQAVAIKAVAVRAVVPLCVLVGQ